MLPHPALSLFCVTDTEGSALSSLLAYLESIPHVRVTAAAQWPTALDAYGVVISHGGEANQGRHPDLEGFIDRGGGWLVLLDGAEQPPALTLHQRRSEGEIIRITPAVAEREPCRFHHNLADHLLWGEPITAPLADSVKVVAILEAAARSMSRGGTLEVINGG